MNAQPKTVRARPPKSVRNRRIAGLCAGVVSVVTAGILSTMFVGYLAERALERAANAPRAIALADSANAAEKLDGQSAAEAKVAVEAPPIIQGIPVKTQPAPAPAAKAEYATASAEPAQADDALDQPAGELAFAEAKPAAAAKKPPEIIKQANPADGTYTAAIPTARPEPDAPAAQPVQKTAAAAPKPAVAAAAPQANEDADSGGENARVNRSVTMRSGPQQGASAIGTIPGKSAITLVSCKSWCEVVYNGKRGFIYKGFVDRS